MVGRVLAGRYRLVAPLGAGASAQVLLADDVQLRRRVAVKVLHEGLAADPTFLRRFQAEAQAAAALNHPNVVAVYDWGQDGVPFIVTEFLDGGSLRAILDRGEADGGLTLSQTLLVGLEACRALHYAHGRGFVHRDIKPANLLYGDDRRLRIADFGLARALAEASWTEPEGVVLGTARYVSPEQAAGAAVDPRSDVYSLALVLFECVTGEVPHSAATAVATLQARVGRSIELDERLGILGPLLEAAGRADPAHRSTAAELGAALMAAAEQLDPPSPIPLVPPRRGLVLADPGPETAIYVEPEPGLEIAMAAGAAAGAEAEAEAGAVPIAPTPMVSAPAASPLPAAPAGLIPTPVATPIPTPAPIPAAPAIVAEESEPMDPPPVPRRKRRRRWSVGRIALTTLLVAALATLGLLAATLFDVSVPGGTASYAVANYTDRDLDAVRAEIGDRFVVEVQDDRADNTARNIVLRQDPEPGTKLDEGATVVLVRAIGPTLVVVPAVIGKSLDDPNVARVFSDATLAVRRVDIFDEAHPTGEILAIDGVATAVERGSTVTVTVSKGAEPRTLVDYATQPGDKTIADLTAKGLQPKQVDEASETVAKGVVIRTEPGPGQQVPKGGAVNVVVSSGKPKLTVPGYLIGMTGRQAEDELFALGWAPTISGPSFGPVIATDPPAGTVRDKGSVIRIITQQN